MVYIMCDYHIPALPIARLFLPVYHSILPIACRILMKDKTNA